MLDTTNAALDEVEQGLFGDLSAADRTTLRALLGRIDTRAEDFSCQE
ncbi:hypothetical protein ACFWSP_02085 [Streptomyces sp. NPDC058618]